MDALNSFAIIDWIIVGVLVMSTLISLVRGFVKEALSLVTLIAAVVISRMFGEQASTLLVPYIETPSLRLGAAYLVLFLLTLMIGGLMNYLISRVVEMAGLGGFDRLLGMVFGLARGGIIVVIAVGVLARMPVTEDEWWKQSILIPDLLAMANRIQAWFSDKTGFDPDSI